VKATQFPQLKTLALLPAGEIEFLFSQLQRLQFKAGELLMRPGDDANRFFIVQSGLLKSFLLNDEGESVVKSFSQAGEIAIDYHGFLQQTPASIWIEALVDCEVLARPSQLSAILYARSPLWVRVDLEVLQFFVLKLSQRETDLLTMNAAENYAKVATVYASVLDSIPKKDLASFLGITPESFSRLLRSFRD
jgi:CRP-like cAMP-binding protein